MSRQLKVNLLHELYPTYLRLVEFYDEDYKKALNVLVKKVNAEKDSMYYLHYPIKTVVSFFDDRLEEAIKNLPPSMRWEHNFTRLKANFRRSYLGKIRYLEEALYFLRVPEEMFEYETPSYFKLLITEAESLTRAVTRLENSRENLNSIENRIYGINKFKTFYDTYSSKLVSLTQEDYDQCKQWLNLNCTPISDIPVPSIPTKLEIPMTYAIMELNNVKIPKS